MNHHEHHMNHAINDANISASVNHSLHLAHDHHVNHVTSDANVSASVDHSMQLAHGHHASTSSHMHHSMSFHFGYNETVLFSFWVISSPAELIMTCILTVFMCFIMESIRWFRGIQPPHDVDLHTEQSAVASIKFAPHITTAMCTDASLHAIQLTISYVLMLLFMTFNVWICAATVFGEVSARLFFAAMYSGNQVRKGNRIDVGCCS
uniref:Copper transport protein n=1 Tax=Onchocerca volvulus TaxID=6282 RepID=A0A8R1TJL2_ONCVO